MEGAQGGERALWRGGHGGGDTAGSRLPVAPGVAVLGWGCEQVTATAGSPGLAGDTEGVAALGVTRGEVAAPVPSLHPSRAVPGQATAAERRRRWPR